MSYMDCFNMVAVHSARFTLRTQNTLGFLVAFQGANVETVVVKLVSNGLYPQQRIPRQWQDKCATYTHRLT